MTDETSQTTDENSSPTFGKRLKSAREGLRLEIKDVASQLRLRTSIIDMLEKEMYSDDMPITFLRGYLRSYAKFLEIPEAELNSALSVEPFQPKIQPEEVEPPAQQTETKSMNKILGYADKSLGGFLNKNTYTILSTSSKYSFKSVTLLFRFVKKYFMPLFTGIIIFTMGYLVMTWWNSHKNTATIMPPLTQNQAGAANDVVSKAATRTVAAPVAAPATPVTAEAQDLDLEATSDDEPAVFEEDPAPKEAAIKPAKNKKTNVSMNQQKNVIDIYND